MKTFLKIFGIIIFSYCILRQTVNGIEESDPEDERFLSSISNLTSLIPGLPQLASGPIGSAEVGLYDLFTSFVNQTRQTIPDIAHHGNFTLIQLGLLCAIGAMAAGAATVVAEGFIFRQHETDLERYHELQSHLSHPPAMSNLPSLTYGASDSHHAASSNQVSLSVPADSYYAGYNKNYPNNNRKKRDTGQSDIDFLNHQVIKSYGLPSKNKKGEVFDPLQLDFNIPTFTNKNQGLRKSNNNNVKKRPQQHHHLSSSSSNLYVNQSPYGIRGLSSGWSGRRRHSPTIQNDNDAEYTRGLLGFKNRRRSDHRHKLKHDRMSPELTYSFRNIFRHPKLMSRKLKVDDANN